MKKRKIVIVSIASLLFLSLVFIPYFPIKTSVNSNNDYSNWMSKNISNNVRFLDIAMPGAHDALAYNINLFSTIDSSGLKAGKVPAIFDSSAGFFLKGFIVRQSNTQISKPSILLKNGVRYLDIRASYVEEKGQWFSTHNYYSSILENDLMEIASFLKNNPGEILILDFQHVFHPDSKNGIAGDKEWTELLKVIKRSGLFDYAYDFDQKALSYVSYGDLTANGSRSSVVIIGKQNLKNSKILNYQDSIRSNWFKTDDSSYLLSSISDEAEKIKNKPSAKNRIRIMQAVKTAEVSPAGFIRAIVRWSLIDEASRFNQEIVESDSFSGWLHSLPVVMVDFSDSSTGEFNSKLMNIIISYNQKLK